VTEPGEDLAARLRALKDRSGLSFGALAQKLHVGTSTLHRYCAGEAVPVEFAVVDRFGRLCGATSEEMAGLHRAWLVADAARARGAEPPVVPVGTGEAPSAPLEPNEPGRRRLLIAVFAAVAVLAGGGIAVAGLLEEDDQPDYQKGAPPSGEVLTASVRSDLWEAGCDHNYLVNLPPERVPEPPVEADALAWSTRVAAVDAGRTIVEVTVAGTQDEPVVLQGLTVRVAARRAPLDWNVYAMSLGCGGALTPATFAVDLDQPRPVARARAGSDGEQALPAVTFPFRVSRTEPVVLRVVAKTGSCDCDWYLDLPYTSGGSAGTLRVDDSGGVPFRTSAAKQKPYGYADGWAR
jgi:hypothetical protein